MDHQYRIYSADARSRRFSEVVRAMANNIRHSYYMAYRLCRKDIHAQYAHSAFGMAWEFAEPFVMAAIFWTLTSSKIVNPGSIAMPYAIFVIYGLFLYQTFCDALVDSVHILPRSKSILLHVHVPPEALLLSVYFRCLFYSIFRIIVMAVFSVVLYASATGQGLCSFNPLGFAKFLLLYPFFVLSAMSLGIFLAPFNAAYSDIGKAVTLMIFPMRYASPVLWALPDTPFFYWLDTLNPISHWLTNLRMLATNNTLESPVLLCITCAISGMLFLAGWYAFHISISIMAEKA